jgi:hypothetical protein
MLYALVSTLHAKRRFEDGEWKVRVWDKGGANLGDYENILIGDTIATGQFCLVFCFKSVELTSPW